MQDLVHQKTMAFHLWKQVKRTGSLPYILTHSRNSLFLWEHADFGSVFPSDLFIRLWQCLITLSLFDSIGTHTYTHTHTHSHRRMRTCTVTHTHTHHCCRRGTSVSWRHRKICRPRYTVNLNEKRVCLQTGYFGWHPLMFFLQCIFLFLFYYFFYIYIFL